MKKIAVIFLFFALLLCTSGFYISWYISLQSIRNSQRDIIAHSDYHKDKIVRFAIAKNAFNYSSDFYFENKNEFEYKNQMYDVINKKIIGDSVYINCISDNEEDNLKDIAICQIIKTGNNTTGKELPVLNFRLDSYTNDLGNNYTNAFAERFPRLYKKYKYDILPAPYLNTSSPPPWHLS